uniref:ORF29 n=1 Tax=Malaco herpesvirus 2 TaxID=3031798 RepID=A0AA48SII7_9VIRU|nr:TPA_asm: ORF29 [Malaco herpesvirus 2]
MATNLNKSSENATLLSEYISFYSFWGNELTEVQLLSSLHLNQLYESLNYDNIRNTYQCLLSYQKILKDDYEFIVVNLASPYDNSIAAVLIRANYNQYKWALDRLTFVFKNILEVWVPIKYNPLAFSDEDLTWYLKTLNLADCTSVVPYSDFPHCIFTICFYQHLHRLSGYENNSNIDITMNDDEVQIFYNNPILNKFASEIIQLASYYVLNPNNKGELIPNKEFVEDTLVNLSEQGVNGRNRIVDSYSTRVCIFCALQNLSLGFVDSFEIYKHIQCEHIFSYQILDHIPLHESLTHSCATTNVRLLMLDRITQSKCKKTLSLDDFIKTLKILNGVNFGH